MKILAVQESDWIDRNPIIHHRLLEALSRRDDDVVVVDFDINWRAKGRRPLRQARSEIRGHHKVFPDSAVTVIRPAMLRIPGLGRVSWLIATWLELRTLLRVHHPDIVIGYGISNAVLACHMAHRESIPFVYHLLDALHTLGEPPYLRRIAAALEAMAMRKADRVIVINRSLRDYARSMGGADSRIVVLPVGWTRTSSPNVNGDEVRRRLSVSENDFLLVYVGFLYTFSGLEELVRELARRHAGLRHVKCLVVGDGDLLEPLARMANDPDLVGRLFVIGRRPLTEVPGLIAAADACVLPALRVPAMEHIVPAKVGEYMESAKLVIATDLPGLRAEFGDLPGVLYVDRPEEVLERVEGLARAPGGARLEARRLGKTCLAFVHSSDDWDQIVKRFRTILESTIAAYGRSASGS